MIGLDCRQFPIETSLVAILANYWTSIQSSIDISYIESSNSLPFSFTSLQFFSKSVHKITKWLKRTQIFSNPKRNWPQLKVLSNSYGIQEPENSAEGLAVRGVSIVQQFISEFTISSSIHLFQSIFLFIENQWKFYSNINKSINYLTHK